jgi:hypothetical protein
LRGLVLTHGRMPHTCMSHELSIGLSGTCSGIYISCLSNADKYMSRVILVARCYKRTSGSTLFPISNLS